MGFADEVRKAARRPSSCWYIRAVEIIPKSELDEVLADRSIPRGAIADKLHEYGITSSHTGRAVSVQSVGDHRNGRCACQRV